MLLYLGPRDRLTSVSMTRTQLQGTAYGEEIERRMKIEMILQPDRAPIFPENEEQPQFPASNLCDSLSLVVISDYTF